MAEFDLVTFMDKAEWVKDANCLGVNSEVFFPARGENTGLAKSICRACDVQAECLAYALNNGEQHGIWGGMSKRERRRIRPIPPPQRIEHGTDYGYHRHFHVGTEPCAACRDAHAAYRRRRRSVTG